MPSAVSTRVSVRPAPSETVRAPLEYEPLAIPIRATPFLTETSLNSGFALGKLAPTRTTWMLPLIEILAAPVTARTRVECCWVTLAVGAAAVGVFEAEADVELLEEPLDEAAWAAFGLTC